MIITKRLFALLAVLAMIGSLASCSRAGSNVSYSGFEPDEMIVNSDEGKESPVVTTHADTDTDTTTASADDTTTAPAGGSTSAKKTTGATKAPVIQTQKPTTPTTKKPASNNAGTVTPQPKPEDIVISGDKVETEETPEVENKVEVVTSHTPLAESKYYQYSTLQGGEKTLYDRIKKAVDKTDNTVDTEDLHMSSKTATKVMRRFMADYPHYFWLSRMFYTLHTGDENNIKALRLLYTDGTKRDAFDNKGNITDLADRKTIANQMDALSKKVKSILATIPTNATAIEKEKAIHDYILDNVVYDDASVGFNGDGPIPHAYDIYGAACQGKAVCEGYSKLFQYLCYCVGINATQVNGQSRGIGHMWNATLIDGKWYQVDVTWDDGAQVHYYKYFNMTTDELKKDHDIDDDELSVPSCTDQSAAYYKFYTMRITSHKKAPENLEKVADQLAKNKEGYLILHVENGKTPTNDYLLEHILGDRSTLGKYISKKGYKFSIKYTYQIYGDGEYLYFPIQRSK